MEYLQLYITKKETKSKLVLYQLLFLGIRINLAVIVPTTLTLIQYTYRILKILPVWKSISPRNTGFLCLSPKNQSIKILIRLGGFYSKKC